MPIAKDVILGPGVVMHHPDLVNLYGCSIGEGSKIGTFVEYPEECIHRRTLQNLVAHLHL